MIVLDTNIVSAMMRPDSVPAVLTWLDTQPTESIWTTTVTLFEIRFGLAVLPPGKRRTALELTFERILKEGRSQAEALARTAELEPERKAAERRDAFDKEVAATLAELKQSQARAAKREDTLHRKLEQLGEREQSLDARDEPGGTGATRTGARRARRRRRRPSSP